MPPIVLVYHILVLVWVRNARTWHASCNPELCVVLLPSVALHKNLFLIAMFLLLRFLKNLFCGYVKILELQWGAVLWLSTNLKSFFRRCSVLPTLELLWSEIVQPELPIYGSSCVDAVSTDVNHFISLGEPDRREMIHAVCSYYICTFFTCMGWSC